MIQLQRSTQATVAFAVLSLVGCDGRLGERFRQRPTSATAAPPASVPTSASSGAAPVPAAVTPRTEAPGAARALSQAFTSAAHAVRPAVVRIDVERETRRQSRRSPSDGDPFFGQMPRLFRHFFDFGEVPDFPELPQPAPVIGTGSGFVIDNTGVIMTNSHVVEGGTLFKVTFFDGQEIPAKVIGKDRRTDVALVRLDTLPGRLTIARLGDSSKLQVGEWVLAIGSPLGLDQTVTVGIISGKGRVGRNVHMSGDRVREYIQTDAKINPGNSGGPLVNLDGEVVGVNTLIRVGAGGAYGFAVPISEAYRVGQLLLKDGRIRYPFLGVNLRDVDRLGEEQRSKLVPQAPSKGAYVAEVIPGSPAARAGIEPGDVVIRLDRTDVTAAEDVVAYVSSRNIGDGIEVTILRGGKSRTVQATLAEAPSDDEVSSASSQLGLSLQTLSPSLAQTLGLPPEQRGAVVSDVAPGGAAQRAGLRLGEVIVEIDRKPVTNADEAMTALGRSGRHLLRVRSAQGFRFITLGGG